ncbi:MAG: hypothetical protein ACRDRL_05145 [Sciscionella sp.]
MSGPTHTLAAILVRLGEHEQQITVQAAAIREQVEQLTGHLGELQRQLEDLQTTRKTLAELPEPQVTSAPAVTKDPPEHPAYEQILTILAAAGRTLRAREVTEAMDLPTTASNVNNVRHKLKRLTNRNLAVEVEHGLFAHVQA